MPRHPSPSTRPATVAARRFALAAALAVVLGGLAAQAAQAHVRVQADSTQSGSFSQLTFRVPNEEDSAGTVTVQVTLPQDAPFLHVSTKPLPGWTATVTEQPLPAPVTVSGTTVTKAPRTVTWQSQAGTRIEPGQYQDFDISAGPLPAAGTVLLPATQTYSDGTVVAWDQPTPAGGAEPEHPAPALVVTAAEVSAGGGTAAPAVASSASPSVAADTSDPVARVLAGAALVVAVVGMVLAVRRRRPTAAR